MELSEKQKWVVRLLQSGEVLIVDRDYVAVTERKKTHRLDVRVFYNLIQKGIIAQQFRHPFDYVLTKLGSEIKL
jgi:hypothetical protein